MTATLVAALHLAAAPSCAANELPQAAPAASKQSAQRKALAVEIRVISGGWGSARSEDIEAVLDSVAAVLLENFPGRRLNPILVSHSEKDPITLYQKGANDEYQVFLAAQDRQWARYAYEFAHELSHILTNYEHHAYSNMTRFNQWFEEALCETASLYALKRLAFAWEVSPPRPHWAAYAPTFERYAERFLNDPRRRLPPNTSLAAWFEQNEAELRKSPYLRGHNDVVANLLLPLFEENPQLWEAIAYLNPGARSNSFREYMQGWYANAPEDYKDIIRYVMALFGLLKEDRTHDPGSTEARGNERRATPSPMDEPPGVAGPSRR